MPTTKYTDIDGDEIVVRTGKALREEFNDFRDEGVIAAVTVRNGVVIEMTTYLDTEASIAIIAQLAKVL